MVWTVTRKREVYWKFGFAWFYSVLAIVYWCERPEKAVTSEGVSLAGMMFCVLFDKWMKRDCFFTKWV